MPAYDRFIDGDYYQNVELIESLTPKKREILNVLRQGYPNALSAKDLKRQYAIPENTAHQYLDLLAKAQIIGKRTERDKKTHRETTKYYFEDYNYIQSKAEDFRLPLAPGYVQYTKKFLDTYNKIRDIEIEDKIYVTIIDYLKIIFQKTQRKFKPHDLEGSCGYDHEARDIIRATLLHLMDELEMNSRFIEFIKENQIITEAKYKDLKKRRRD